MSHKTIVIALAVATLIGCAAPQQRVDPNVLVLQVYSEPPGAAIYFHSQGEWKPAPPTGAIRLQIPANVRAAGKSTLNGIAARWASGAVQTDKQIPVDFSNGLQQQYTIHRPANTAGLDQDLRYAASLAARQAQQDAAQAREDRRQQAQADALMEGLAAGIEGYNRGRYESSTTNNYYAPPASSPQPPMLMAPPTVNCTTTRSGDRAYTTCR